MYGNANALRLRNHFLKVALGFKGIPKMHCTSIKLIYKRDGFKEKGAQICAP
jgi:hypothetical protein